MRITAALYITIQIIKFKFEKKQLAMLTKKKIIESIKAMPEDDFEDIDVLLERIVVLDKIERGLKDVENGDVISNEEMKTIIDSWFKK